MSDRGREMWLAAQQGRVQEMLELFDDGVSVDWKHPAVSNPRALPAHRPAPRRPTHAPTARPPRHPRRLHPRAARRVGAR